MWFSPPFCVRFPHSLHWYTEPPATFCLDYMLDPEVGEVADTVRRRCFDDRQYLQNLEETQSVPPIPALTEGLKRFHTWAIKKLYIRGHDLAFSLYVTVINRSSYNCIKRWQQERAVRSTYTSAGITVAIFARQATSMLQWRLFQ